MSKTDELERDIRKTREQLSSTVRQLRYRARPQRMLSDLANDARYGGAARFVKNLQADLGANAVPLTVLAAGLGWLMFRPNPRSLPLEENGYVAAFDRARQYVSAAREKGPGIGSAIQDRAASTKERIGAVSRQTANTAAAVAQSAQGAAAVAKEAVGSTIQAGKNTADAVSISASSGARTVTRSARGSARAVEKHPALFAGTVVAISGAAALAFFFGRSMRDEVASLMRAEEPLQPLTPERALALVDESALTLVPANQLRRDHLNSEADLQLHRTRVSS